MTLGRLSAPGLSGVVSGMLSGTLTPSDRPRDTQPDNPDIYGNNGPLRVRASLDAELFPLFGASRSERCQVCQVGMAMTIDNVGFLPLGHGLC